MGIMKREREAERKQFHEFSTSSGCAWRQNFVNAPIKQDKNKDRYT